MNLSNPAPRAGLIACLAIGTLVAACHRDDPKDQMTRAKEAAAKGNHAAAIIEFKNVLQKDPGATEARFGLGSELLAQGDAKNAEIELQKAYDAHFDPDKVVPLLVKSQALQGETDKVVRQVGKGDMKTPAANAAMQTLLGGTLFAQGKLNEASAAYAAAVKFSPDYPEALVGEARVRANRGDMTGAEALVTSVLAKEPKQVDGLILKGDLARAKGANAEAIAAYEAAVKENPRTFTGRLNLAGAYIAGNQLDLAQQQVDALKKLAPKQPGVLYMDALIAFSKKDLPRANDAISVSLTSAPNSGLAQLLAGAISSGLNQPAQAEAHLREALKLMPNSLYARKLLTSLYLRQRQPQKAEETLAPALASAPNDATIASLGAEVALLKGDFGSAAKFFDKAAKINPADANVRTQGAAVDFARGDEAGGFAELEAASKLANNNPNPDIALILARIQRKQFDQAAAAWKTLEKRQPDNPLTYNLRAAIDMGKGDNAAARKSLEHAVELQPTYFPAVANLAGLDERSNDLESARKRYKNLLAKEPGNLSALLTLAEFENRHTSDPGVVVSLLKEARRANPNAEQPVLALTSYYGSKNDPKNALATIQEGLAQTPNSASFLTLNGQLLLQSGSFDQAMAAFRKLVTINPEAVDAQILLAQAQLAANQPDAAIQTFRNGLRNHPTAYRGQAIAIGALLRANQVDAASKILADVRQTAPKSPFLPELEGDVKLGTKQYADAATIFRKLLAQTAPTPPSLVIKAYSATYLSGKVPEANAFIAEWVKTHPKDISIRMFDADVALRSKDFARATQDYRVALELKPNDPIVMNNLAWSMWQQKDPQALAMAQKATSLAPGNASIADTLGWMLVEQGQTKRGIEVLESAIAKAPGKHDIALHLAKAQLKDGRKEAARATLQSVVDAAPDSAEGKESEDLMATL